MAPGRLTGPDIQLRPRTPICSVHDETEVAAHFDTIGFKHIEIFDIAVVHSRVAVCGGQDICEIIVIYGLAYSDEALTRFIAYKSAALCVGDSFLRNEISAGVIYFRGRYCFEYLIDSRIIGTAGGISLGEELMPK